MQDVNVAVDPQQNAGQVETAPQYAPQQPAYAPSAQYGAGPGQQAAPQNDAVGCTGAAWKRVFTSPVGILRAVEWLFAIIAFGAMSDNEIFDKKSAFEFVVAMGVLTWLFVMVAIAIEIFNAYASYPILNVTVLICDILFAALCFIAGIAAGVQCNEKVVSGFDLKWCDSQISGHGKVKAGVAFIFLTSFLLMISAFFSFKRWRLSKP